MAYLLIVFWLGGASVTVIDKDAGNPTHSKVDSEARNFAACINAAKSVRKHFKRDDIIRIKCVPEKVSRK